MRGAGFQAWRHTTTRFPLPASRSRSCPRLPGTPIKREEKKEEKIKMKEPLETCRGGVEDMDEPRLINPEALAWPGREDLSVLPLTVEQVYHDYAPRIHSMIRRMVG